MCDYFVFWFEIEDVYYWFEDFFVYDFYVVVVIIEYGWCDVLVVVEMVVG